MKVTKYGHCCMLIEEGGLRTLTDPGVFAQEAQEAVRAIDIVLITHEHPDHFHLESLKKVLVNNPAAKIVCNRSVGALLQKEHIEFVPVGEGESFSERGLSFEGFGHEHALIHASMQGVENTGYFIGERLFYPGDAFTNPKKAVDVLAFPVAGPWMKFSEAVDYVLALKPKKCFPVHDGIISLPGMMAYILTFPDSAVLKPAGIELSIVEQAPVEL